MEEEINRSKRGFGPPIQSSKILENAAPAERDSKLKSKPRKKSACKKESQLQRERLYEIFALRPKLVPDYRTFKIDCDSVQPYKRWKGGIWRRRFGGDEERKRVKTRESDCYVGGSEALGEVRGKRVRSSGIRRGFSRVGGDECRMKRPSLDSTVVGLLPASSPSWSSS